MSNKNTNNLPEVCKTGYFCKIIDIQQLGKNYIKLTTRYNIPIIMFKALATVVFENWFLPSFSLCVIADAQGNQSNHMWSETYKKPFFTYIYIYRNFCFNTKYLLNYKKLKK